MEKLKDVISDIGVFIYGGIRTLPLTIAGTLTILGLFTANFAIIFFLLGYLIGIPLISFGCNAIGSLIFDFVSYNPFKVKKSDVCNINIPYLTMKNMKEKQEEETVLCSQWMAMILFFFGYIIGNAVELFSLDTHEEVIKVSNSTESDIIQKEGNRKMQAVISLCSTIVLAIGIIGYRVYTGCEPSLNAPLTIIVFVVSIAFFGGLGYLWYLFLGTIGQHRLSDIFGIANRLLPPSAIINAPVACVPIV
jgi:hypothetical protein